MSEIIYTRPTFVEMGDGCLINLDYIKTIKKKGKIKIAFEVDSQEQASYEKVYPTTQVRDMMYEGFVQSIGKREIKSNE